MTRIHLTQLDTEYPFYVDVRPVNGPTVAETTRYEGSGGHLDPSIVADPPAINTALHIFVWQTGTTWDRLVTFHGDDVTWETLTDVDPDTLHPVPTGETYAAWDALRRQILAAGRGAKGDPGDDGRDGTDGTDGSSAYQLATLAGFIGTVSDWLASLKGDKGDKGDQGEPGQSIKGDPGEPGASIKGDPGEPGAPGASIKGDPGDPGAPGAPGASAYEVATAAGFAGTVTAWLASLKGPKGDPGTPGTPGADGASAYQLAVAGGFVGTVTAWLASLKGTKGDKGDTGAAATAAVTYPATGVTFYNPNGAWADGAGKATRITKASDGTVIGTLGAFKNSFVIPDDVIGTLPLGSRPSVAIPCVGQAYSQSGGGFTGFIMFTINTDGTIVAGGSTADQPRSVHGNFAFTTL